VAGVPAFNRDSFSSRRTGRLDAESFLFGWRGYGAAAHALRRRRL